MSNVKFKNDRYYEETVVQALIVDNNYAEQMLEVLNPNYFNVEYLKEVSKLMFAYHNKYKAFPSYKLLVNIVRTEVSDDILKEQIINYFIKIKKDTAVSDIEYVKNTSLEFCKKKALERAMEACLSLIEEKKFEQIVGEIQKALQAGSDKDIGHEFLPSFDLRMEREEYLPVPTPWEEVNRRIKGGLGRGKLAAIGALTGIGKSHALIDLGAHAVTVCGLNVIHYTLELDHIDTGNRYDARISDIAFDDLHSNKDLVKERINERTKGKLVIKSYPTKAATVQTLKNHFNNLKLRGIEPDLVLIDYADLLKSKENYDSKRLNEEAIYEELRAWAMEAKLPIWTVTQINREGMDAEVLTLKYIAECFAKAMIVDLFITMNRKKDSPTPEIGNMFIAKNRLGVDGIKLPMLINTSMSKIEILAQEFTNEGDEVESDGMEKLRKKYKSFAKDKLSSKSDSKKPEDIN
jgi:replicative DNA helicase